MNETCKRAYLPEISQESQNQQHDEGHEQDSTHGEAHECLSRLPPGRLLLPGLGTGARRRGRLLLLLLIARNTTTAGPRLVVDPRQSLDVLTIDGVTAIALGGRFRWDGVYERPLGRLTVAGSRSQGLWGGSIVRIRSSRHRSRRRCWC